MSLEIIQLDITNASEEYLKFIGDNTIWGDILKIGKIWI